MRKFLFLLLACCTSAFGQSVQYRPTGFANTFVQTIGSQAAAQAYFGLGSGTNSPLLNGTNIFTGTNVFTGPLLSSNVNSIYYGDGSHLTGVVGGSGINPTGGSGTNNVFYSAYLVGTTTISNLTSSRVLVIDEFGHMTNSSVSNSTLTYLDIPSSLTALLALSSNAVLSVSNNLITVSNTVTGHTTDIGTLSNALLSVSNNLITVSNTAVGNTANIATASNAILALSNNLVTVSNNLIVVSNGLLTVSNTVVSQGNTLGSNVALLNGTNTLTGTNIFTGVVLSSNTSSIYYGDGSHLTGITGGSVTNLGNGVNSVIATNLNLVSASGSNLVYSVATNGTDVFRVDQNASVRVRDGNFNDPSLFIGSIGMGKYDDGWIMNNGSTYGPQIHYQSIGMRGDVGSFWLTSDANTSYNQRKVALEFQALGNFKVTQGATAGLGDLTGRALYFTNANVTNITVNGGATVTGILSATASLNFDLTAVTVEDLTVTVTGAAVGDVVALGAPNGAVTATIQFTAWVSASDTVTVRARTEAAGEDPAEATFRATVIQH